MNSPQKQCQKCRVEAAELFVCTGCRKVSYCSQKCQKSDWGNHKPTCKQTHISTPAPTPLPTLSQAQIGHLIHTIKHNYLNIYRLIYLIDQSESDKFKARNTHYYNQHQQQHDHKHSGCCSSALNNIYIPEKEMTVLESVVYEVTKTSSIRDCLGELLEYCEEKLRAIKGKGIADGLKFDQEAEKYLVGQVMTEGCQHYFLTKIRKIVAEKNKIDAKQPMLFATANTWYAKYPNIKLEFLESNFIKNLSENGYGIATNWVSVISSSQALIDQLSFQQKDGRFDEPISQEDVRNDRAMWVSPHKTEFPSLFRLVSKLYSIPFELNTKCSLACVISQTIQASYFKQNGLHKSHIEGSFTEDSGKKFSVLLPLGQIKVALTNTKSKEIINCSLKPGSLLIFKSRAFACQIQCGNTPTFLIRYWINGPVQIDT